MNLISKPFKYTFFCATGIIVALNVLVFAAGKFVPYLDAYLGLSVAGCIKYHFWWQPVTYMFVHANFSHIFFNMFGLLCFGILVEKAIGSWEFLLLYFFCGIFDGLISLLLYFLLGTYNVNLIGASGALYSVLLVYAVVYPRSVISIWGIIPVPAPLLVLIYAVIELVSQFFGSSNVAHLTHLTGFALAYLYLLVRMKVNPVKVWKQAWHK